MPSIELDVSLLDALSLSGAELAEQRQAMQEFNMNQDQMALLAGSICRQPAEVVPPRTNCFDVVQILKRVMGCVAGAGWTEDKTRWVIFAFDDGIGEIAPPDFVEQITSRIRRLFPRLQMSRIHFMIGLPRSAQMFGSYTIL
jgi:hypothetical protein